MVFIADAVMLTIVPLVARIASVAMAKPAEKGGGGARWREGRFILPEELVNTQWTKPDDAEEEPEWRPRKTPDDQRETSS